jgi:hypothetical protein
MELDLVMRIIDCEENGWTDLQSKLDRIVQSLIDNPSAGRQVKTALQYWADAVDCRLKGVPPDEDEIIVQNPIMNIRESFGTEV